MTKMTYVDALNIAIAAINDTEAKERLEALRATIANRKSGPSKKKVEEMHVKLEAVYEALLANDEPVTVTDLIKGASNEVADFSNQKASAILKKLCEDGRAIKTVEKRKTYYAVAE